MPRLSNAHSIGSVALIHRLNSRRLIQKVAIVQCHTNLNHGNGSHPLHDHKRVCLPMWVKQQPRATLIAPQEQALSSRGADNSHAQPGACFKGSARSCVWPKLQTLHDAAQLVRELG